jgi:flagellar protein FlaJ
MVFEKGFNLKKLKLPKIDIPFLKKKGPPKAQNKAQFYVIVFGFLGALLFLGSLVFFGNAYFLQTLLVLSVLVGVLPLVILQYMNFKRAKQIELFLPDFLRDVAESNRSGMPLVRAIESASHGAYGPLTEEMTMVSAQISWGVPFEETLEKFAERIKSRLVKQAITIIVQSHRSGGNIADILETVSTDVKTLKRIEGERKSKLKIYLISIYMIFFLFLGIIVTLTITFIPATPELNKAAGLLGGTPSPLSEDDFKNYFFHLSLIQAFFAGLIGGQMGEGNVLSGVKHSVALLVVTIAVFQLFLAPPPFGQRLAETITKIPPGSQNVESSTTAFTIYDSVTSADVLERVKQIALEKRLQGYDELDSETISFSYSDCVPCTSGDLEVTDFAIIVRSPSKITYNVISIHDSYKVIIGGKE